MKKHAVVIIGAGPGGSTAAAWLAQRSVDVALIEREEYPRFHIGESLLPASMPILQQTGALSKIDCGKYIRKYGARFIDYANEEQIYFGFQDGLNRQIPSAFEVPRAEFDRDLLEHAVQSGATLHQPECVQEVELQQSGVRVLGTRDEYQADYLIDASGRDCVLGKHFKVRQANKDLNNIAVFAHYRGVRRQLGDHEGDITVGLLGERAWSWLIPFKGDVTSVGVVCSSASFNGAGRLTQYLEQRLLESPQVRADMQDAVRVSEVMSIGNYSHTCDRFFGDRWLLCGDAALFLDPIFSSGVHLALASSHMAAQTIFQAMSTGASLRDADLGQRYEDTVRLGAKRFKSLISLFYQGDFVSQMKKVLARENMRKGFTSAVAGDVWNEDNFLFQKQVL